MNANYFFVFSMTILLMGCNDKYSKTVYDPNDAEEIELNHQTSDIKITPLFCSEPMDGILQAKLYKDYLFLLGDKREHVYCIKNDSVISILNNKGRGHGEYTFIRDMAYDETNSVLYVKAENVILKYRVPSMSYLGELEGNYTTSGMLVLNPDELLVHCNFWEDESCKNLYEGLCVVSTKTGEIIRRCYMFNYYEGSCLRLQDFLQDNNKILVPRNGMYNNSIISLDPSNGHIEELKTFSYSTEWRLSKDLIKYLKKGNYLEYANEESERNKKCDGCHKPAIINSRLTCWCYPKTGNSKSIPTVMIFDNDRIISRHFKVSGTNLYVNCFYLEDNHCVQLIDGDPESFITDPDALTDFGKEIYSTLKKQNYNNPILMSFTIDKGL